MENTGQLSWRRRLHEIIFESDTIAGRAFDITLSALILTSVGLVMLDSVAWIHALYGQELYLAEWVFTIVFTIEFGLRMIIIRQPFRYLFSFYGIVDILAIVPTYLSLFIPGAQNLMAIRVFRLLRIFRIFKLGRFLGEADVLTNAFVHSRHKIVVFLLAVMTTAVTVGTLMFVIEGPQHGFHNIPMSVYWAIVTMTTVGFGDMTPKTPAGQFLASCLMILGYGVLAVPTGIVTTELVKSSHIKQSGQSCPNCSLEGHDYDAVHCKHCGASL